VVERDHELRGAVALSDRRTRWTVPVRGQIRWDIRSEREVQDIVWIMLRSVFDDVVDEDTLPKFGHKSYRADFGLPRLGVLVEIKYIYTGSNEEFKAIENEVMVDSVAYLQNTDRYQEIVVFIYDQSSSVQHHDTTRQALLQLNGVTDVIIVSRPGHVAATARTRRGAKQRPTASAD
jgi:hypothetical protein